MSLINDALKRAGTNLKPAASAGSAVSAVEPPMVAVTASALAAKPRQGTPVAMIVGMVALTAVAAWFFLKWREASTGQTAIEASSPAKPAPAPAANVQTPPPAPPVAKASAPATPAAPKPSAPPVAAATKIPAPAVAAKPPVAVPQPTVAAASAQSKPEPQPMPELKLQAIVFRMKNPSALINGRHVEVGDDVSGARVTEIHRTTVIVEWQGQKAPLQMK